MLHAGDRDGAIETHVHQLGRYLIGRSPFDIKHFTYGAYTDFAAKRGAMDLYCAISGIEQALWDIVGKATGQPVYNLLGGAFRTRIRVYANGWAERRKSRPGRRAGAGSRREGLYRPQVRPVPRSLATPDRPQG